MRRASVVCALAVGWIAVFAGCAQVAGVSTHQLEPAADGGAEAAPSDAGPDSDPYVDQNPWSAIPEECNFVDDDHDGATDEEFRWRVGEWHLVHTGDSISLVEAVRVSSGGIAAMVLEGPDPGKSSRAALRVLSPDGEVLLGPTDVWSGPGSMGTGIAATSAGEVGVALKPATDDCDGGGCPIEVRRYLTSDLSSAGSTILDRAAIHPDAIPTQRLLDLGWTGAGYVALAVDGGGFARLVWENPLGIDFSGNWNGVIDETRAYSGSLSVGPVIGYGLYREGASAQQEYVAGMSSLGAYKQLLRPAVVLAGGGGTTLIAPGGKRTAVWSDSDLVVMLVVQAPTQQRTTRLGRVRFDGHVTTLLPLMSEGYLLAGEDANLLVAVVADGGFDLLRFGSALSEVGESIPVADAWGLAVVATGGVPVVFRVTADRKAVYAAALECE